MPDDISIEASYTKTLGLPGYSSHSFTVTMRKRLRRDTDLETESERLHERLQRTVDDRMRLVGYVPEPGTYPEPTRVQQARSWQASGWVATDGQRILLNNLIAQHRIQQADVRSIAVELFGNAVQWPLNGADAGRLIEELVRRFAPDAEPEHEFNQE